MLFRRDRKNHKGRIAVDLQKTLSSLTEVAKESSEKKKSGNASWITGLVMFFVALLGVFIFALISWKNSRELARLRHEKNVAKVKADNAVFDAAAAKNVEEVVELQGKLKEHLKEMTELSTKELEIKNTHMRNKKAIGEISNWDDIK